MPNLPCSSSSSLASSPVPSCSSSSCSLHVFPSSSASSSASALASASASYSPSQRHSCPICLEDDVGDESVLQLYTFSTCGHYFCFNCAKTYLLFKLDASEVVDVTCPGKDCSAVLPDSDIESLLQSDVKALGRFMSLREQLVLKHHPDAHYCPLVDCATLQLVDPHANSHICEVCELEFEPCDRTRHAPVVVSEAADLSHLSKKEQKRLLRAQTKLEKKTRKWKRRHGVRECPRCGLEFYKFNGCPRMQCPGCRTCFSANTGRIYERQTQEETYMEALPRFPQHMYWHWKDTGRKLRKRPKKAPSIILGYGLGISLLYIVLMGIPFLVIGLPLAGYRSFRTIRRVILRSLDRDPSKHRTRST
eukprot:CAMPEP_0177635722 /NCGR_PEP_ID=MMETSP0447-20121125/4059_1 /TAXON_ID=0 /ORGANISM="Stygamoeba regulata, Strain BSH-02190019" /LENGTH=362 /DNA_ID=CAMNT_0019137541 /DNA_START=45 /DNA_END=1133 /DNA_ORIENTATION=-